MSVDKEVKKQTPQEKYRKKNLKQYANYQKIYRRKNPEKIRAYEKAYRLKRAQKKLEDQNVIG